MSGSRDYGKFLTQDGRLDARLLPRQVYTALVTHYRQQEDIIADVFQELYLTWDLTQVLDAQAARGDHQDVATAAQVVLDSLEDNDWWRVMAAFEVRFMRDFLKHAEAWADTLNPVYDANESEGWRRPST